MMPQIIWIVIVGLSLGINAEKHGKLKKGKCNAYYVLIAVIIEALILWWGGFWDCFT